MAAPQRTSIMDLIRTSVGSQFVIPVYQRKYTWLANKQVKQLLDDYDNLLSGKTNTHFVGIIIYIEKGITGTFREWAVVDGQQRLTTLFLMLQALKYVAKEKGDIAKSQEIESVYLTNPIGAESTKFRLKPIISEDGVYQKIASDQLANISDAEIHTNCYKNYEYIHAYFRSKVDNNVSIDELLSALNKLEVVYIPLEYTDNAQQIFESINSTGVELSPADLIRNFLLMDLKNDEQEKFYSQYWEVLENQLTTSSNISEFFRFYLSIKKYELIKKDEVYAAFKLWQKEEIENIKENGNDDVVEARETILKDVLQYARCYYNIYMNDNAIKELPALVWYRKTKSVMPAPFLMEMYRIYSTDQSALSAADFNEMVDLIDTYLVRRALCERPTSNITRTFPTLLRNVLNYAQETGQSLLECTKYCLVNKNKNNLLKMPNDKELEEVLWRVNAYSNDATRHVLEKIENFGNNIEIKNLNDLSVEHLLPQAPTPYWREKIHAGQYEDYVNLIGNLTLASGLDNSKMSNRPWVDPKKNIDKKSILEETGHLKLNMELLQLPEWNSETIIERTKCVISKIKELYKYRESTMQQRSWVIKLKPTVEHIAVDAILFEDGMVTVLPDSECVDSSESKIEAYSSLYNELVESSIIKPMENGRAKFIKEWSFSSISAAAGFVLDSSRNGWDYFLTEDGNSLETLRKKYFSKSG